MDLASPPSSHRWELMAGLLNFQWKLNKRAVFSASAVSIPRCMYTQYFVISISPILKILTLASAFASSLLLLAGFCEHWMLWIIRWPTFYQAFIWCLLASSEYELFCVCERVSLCLVFKDIFLRCINGNQRDNNNIKVSICFFFILPVLVALG